MHVDDVNLDLVMSSPEGLAYWGTKDIDVGRNSGTTQAFRRALRSSPYWKENYPILLQAEAEEFKQSWAIKRDFTFTEEMRIVRMTLSESAEDIGEPLTKLQLLEAWGQAGSKGSRTSV